MRVLVLGPHPYYIDRGTPIDVDILLRALSERGERVDALVYADGEDRHYENVRLHRIPSIRFLHGARPGPSLKKLLSDVLFFFTALRLVLRNDYDVIHAGEEAAAMALVFRLIRGVPYVYDMDSSVAQQIVERFGWLRFMAPLFNRVEALLLRHCVAAAPVCLPLAKLAETRGAPVVFTLHDISQLEPPAEEEGPSLRERLGVPGPVVLYVGNLEPYQGIDLLLESFVIASREHEGLTLAIAGGQDGDIRAYRRKAERLGIGDRTHFLGRWPVTKLGALLRSADILVAPRIKGINTPQKVFPYLHSGIAVLVTGIPAHTMVLDSSVAYIAAPEPAAFAKGMVELARDPELRQRLGEAGRAFVERNHTFSAHRRRVDELYDYLAQTILRR